MFECNIPVEIMENPDICLGAKGFFAYLTAITDETGSVSPGTAYILEELKISKDVCRKYARELVAGGCIETRRDMSCAAKAGNRRIEYQVKTEIPDSGKENECRVYTDCDIPVEAKGLYAYLAAHADENGNVVLKRERILKDLSCTKTTFTKYAAELENLGCLKRGRYYNEEGRAAGILYELKVES